MTKSMSQTESIRATNNILGGVSVFPIITTRHGYVVEGRKSMGKPNVLSNIDTQRLVKICEQYLTDLGNGRNRDDADHYIFEAALETVYGLGVWEFVNEKL